MTPYFGIFLGFLAVLIVALFGRMDYDDEVQQEKAYCENVKNDVWPDYENIYEKVCKKYELVVDE